MKSFMFSRLWHLLLQLASTVPRNIIKDKDKVKDKSAHLAHLHIRTNFWACCCPWILMCTSCTLLCACLSFGWPANIFTIPHCDCNESQGVGASRLSSKKHFQSCGFWRVARNYTFEFWSTFEVKAVLLAVHRSFVQISSWRSSW